MTATRRPLLRMPTENANKPRTDHPARRGMNPLAETPVTRTPFDSYLSEVNRTPLLSADAENDLASRIAGGDPAARDEMVLANLRLVICIARRYVGKGVALEDLIEEGNLGLLRAVEGFDPTMNSRFSTYASYWIKQSIRVALNKSGHAVRLPQYMGTLLFKWRQAETDLRGELGREPSREEVTAHLGLTARQVRAVAKGQKAVTSGRAVGAVGEERPAELLADLGAGPADRLTTEDCVRAALDTLDQLGNREATILRLRFGLGGGEPATLKQVGEQLGLTRERVRQIEHGALADLRHRLNA